MAGPCAGDRPRHHHWVRRQTDVLCCKLHGALHAIVSVDMTQLKHTMSCRRNLWQTVVTLAALAQAHCRAPNASEHLHICNALEAGQTQPHPTFCWPTCRYNISNFDLPYLIDRAAALKLTKFPYWGRLKNKCVCRRVCACAQILAGRGSHCREGASRSFFTLSQGTPDAGRAVQQQGVRDARLQGDHHRRARAAGPATRHPAGPQAQQLLPQRGTAVALVHRAFCMHSL